MLGVPNGRLGRGDLNVQPIELMLIHRRDVLTGGRPGGLVGDFGVLVIGLGAMLGDHLVGELVPETGRVELADEVPFFDVRPLRDNLDDRCRALDGAVRVLVPGTPPRPRA